MNIFDKPFLILTEVGVFRSYPLSMVEYEEWSELERLFFRYTTDWRCENRCENGVSLVIFKVLLGKLIDNDFWEELLDEEQISSLNYDEKSLILEVAMKVTPNLRLDFIWLFNRLLNLLKDF